MRNSVPWVWPKLGQAAEALAGEQIKRIISSPLSRANRTAEAVIERPGLTVETDPNLMEFNSSIYQGQLYQDWIYDYWDGNYTVGKRCEFLDLSG